MTKNIHNISIRVQYDNQLMIGFDGTKTYVDRDWTIREEDFVNGGFERIYQIELHSFYHNLAKRCNELFGTDFEYSRTFIDKVKFARIARYNIHYEYNWDLVNILPNHCELVHHYWYEGYRKDVIGLSGISTTTYGEYDKDSIIALVKAVGQAIFEDGIDERVYEELKERYDANDRFPNLQYDKEWGWDERMDIEKLVAER